MNKKRKAEIEEEYRIKNLPECGKLEDWAIMTFSMASLISGSKILAEHNIQGLSASISIAWFVLVCFIIILSIRFTKKGLEKPNTLENMKRKWKTYNIFESLYWVIILLSAGAWAHIIWLVFVGSN